MRQTPKNEGATSLEMGFTSMTFLLKEISTNSVDGVKLLDSIANKFDGLVSTSIGGILQNSTNLLKYFTAPKNKMLIGVQSIDRNLSSLAKNLNELYSVKNNISEETPKLVGGIVNVDLLETPIKNIDKNLSTIVELLQKQKSDNTKLVNNPKGSKQANTEKFSFKNFMNGTLNSLAENLLSPKEEKRKTNTDKILSGNVDLKQTNLLLGQINEGVSGILDSLEKNSKSDNKKDVEGGKAFNIMEFVKSVVTLKATITKKFLSNIEKFYDVINNYAKIDVSKFKLFRDEFTKFSGDLQKSSQSLNELSTSLLKIGAAVILLSLAFVNPLFAVGAGVLVLMVRGLANALDKDFDGKKVFDLASGIGILSLSLIVLGFVPLTSIIKMVAFVGLLGFAVRSFDSKGKNEKSPLTSLAFGISILTISMLALEYVSWESGLKMLLFVGGLGLVMKSFGNIFGMGKTMTPPLTQFALGIGILVLSLYAIRDIDWADGAKLLVFIGGLGLVLKLFMSGEDKRVPPLTKFAFGIGILVLSLFAMQEIEWSSMFKLVTFIGLIGIALKLFSGKGEAQPIHKFALGIGILVLSMLVIEYVSWESATKMVLFIGALGLVLKLYNDKTNESMLKLGAGLLLMGIAFAVVANSPMTLEKALIFGGSVLILSAIMVGLGIPVVAGFATTGSLTMILVAVSSLVIAGVLGLISIIPINFTNIGLFALAVFGLAVAFSLALPFAVLAVASSVLLLPMAITSFLIASSLAMIEGLKFENVGAFILGIMGLAVGFATILPFAAIGILGATLMIPIGVSALMFAGLLTAISALNVDTAKIDNFNSGMQSLIKGYGNFDGITLFKTAVKASMMLPIFVSALAGALVLESISKLNLNENKIGSFGEVTKLFVDSMVNALKDNIDSLKKIEPGLTALSKLVNVASGLADVVLAFSNMNYNIYGVKDGKLQIIGVRKITDTEIAQVGVNVGKLIQGLMIPLAVISSDEKVWDFGGGIKVNNPFAGGWFGTDNNSGINRLTKIGEAFTPLADAVSKLSNMSMFSDPKGLETFNTNLLGVIDTFGKVFDKVGSWSDKDVSFEKIVDFVEGFKDVELEGFKSMSDLMEKFLNNLSDEEKWKRITSNVTNLKDGFKGISQNINLLNLEKAAALERNMKILSEQDTNNNFKEIIEKLKEMIGLLYEKASPNVTVVNSGNSGESSTTKEKVETAVKDEFSKMVETMQLLLTDISTKIESTNQKLSGKLKVVNITGNSNEIR